MLPSTELMLTIAAFFMQYSLSSSIADAAPAFNNGNKAFVNINGDVVLTAKVSAMAAAVTKLILVDLGDIPALFISKFSPFSPTIEDTSSAMSSKVSCLNTSKGEFQNIL